MLIRPIMTAFSDGFAVDINCYSPLFFLATIKLLINPVKDIAVPINMIEIRMIAIESSLPKAPFKGINKATRTINVNNTAT